MKRMFLKSISIFIIICFILGCAGMNDSTRTKSEGAGVGAAGGAAIGALLGQIIGGDTAGTLIGAAIGAAVGGVAGYVAGSSVADRKEKYASEEDRINGEIDIIAQYNKELEDYNQKTVQKNIELEKQVADLKSSKNIDESALTKKKDEITLMISESNKRKEAMNKELAALEKYHQSVANTMDQTKVTQLAKEISVLKKNIAMLDNNNIQMAKINSSIVSR